MSNLSYPCYFVLLIHWATWIKLAQWSAQSTISIPKLIHNLSHCTGWLLMIKPFMACSFTSYRWKKETPAMIFNLCFYGSFLHRTFREWSSVSYITFMTLLSQDSLWAVGVILLLNNCKFFLTLWLSDFSWSAFIKTASCTPLLLTKLRSHVEKKLLKRKLSYKVWYTVTRQIKISD